MKHDILKRTLAGVLAVLCVAGTVPASVGPLGLSFGTAVRAFADDTANSVTDLARQISFTADDKEYDGQAYTAPVPVADAGSEAEAFINTAGTETSVHYFKADEITGLGGAALSASSVLNVGVTYKAIDSGRATFAVSRKTGTAFGYFYEDPECTVPVDDGEHYTQLKLNADGSVDAIRRTEYADNRPTTYDAVKMYYPVGQTFVVTYLNSSDIALGNYEIDGGYSSKLMAAADNEIGAPDKPGEYIVMYTYTNGSGSVSVFDNFTIYNKKVTVSLGKESYEYSVSTNEEILADCDIDVSGITAADKAALIKISNANGEDVTDKDHLDAGTYTLSFNDKITENYPLYDFSFENDELVIDPLPIDSTVITNNGGAASAVYVGNDQSPDYDLVNTELGEALVKNTDYSISKAKNVGSYTLTITGMGNYTGSFTVPFEITPAEIKLDSISDLPPTVNISSGDPTYNGKPLTGRTFTATCIIPEHERIIDVKKYYKVSSDGETPDEELAEAPIDVGTYYAIVTISDKNGNYTPVTIKTVQFSIDKKSVYIVPVKKNGNVITEYMLIGFCDGDEPTNEQLKDVYALDGNNTFVRSDAIKPELPNYNVNYIESKGIPDEAVEAGAVVTAANVTLGGELGLNFYVKINDDVAEGAKAVLSGPAGDKEIAFSELEKDTSGKYVVSYPVSAIKADKDITMKIVDAEGNDLGLFRSDFSEIEGDSFTYSIYDYFDSALADDSKLTDEEKEQVKATYTYCAYAIKWKYGTKLPDSKYINELPDITADSVSTHKMYQNGSNDEISITSISLTLDSNTSFNVFFKCTDDIEGHTITIDGEEVTPVLVSGNKYYVKINSIGAKNLQKDYCVAFDDYSVTFDAMCYVYSTLNNPNEQSLIDVSKAVYAYSEMFKS